jgi:hypothetical protein
MHKHLVRALFAGLVASTCVTPAQADPADPAAERLAIAAYQESIYPALLRDIQAAAGFKVPVEVQWDRIARPGESDRYSYEGYWTEVFFIPLKTALQEIAVDETGKKALATGLKRVVITRKDDAASSAPYKGLKFEAGTLTINFEPLTSTGNDTDRPKAIRKELENALKIPEHRAIAAYQENIYPGLLRDIQIAAGFAVPVEVQWDEIATPTENEHYSEEGYWTNIFFIPLKNALQAITATEKGRQALAANLKKTVITYDGSTSTHYPARVKFEAGVLTLDFRPWANPKETDLRSKAIQKVLENTP